MKIDYTHITSHQSSREGARIHLAVLHTTEGSDSPAGNPPSDLVTLGNIFDGEEASAHLGVNVDGKIGRYVEDSQKAWAVCNYNSSTISLEQIGFAAFTEAEWFKRHAQLIGAAEFLQYVNNHYGVPIRKGKVSGGGIDREGVVQHKDLGIIGCGHTDCGDGYPQGYVELLARFYLAREHKHFKLQNKLAKKINRIRRKHGVKQIG